MAPLLAPQAPKQVFLFIFVFITIEHCLYQIFHLFPEWSYAGFTANLQRELSSVETEIYVSRGGLGES